MSDLVRCPQCGADFELSVVIRDQLAGEIRDALEHQHQREVVAATERVRRAFTEADRQKEADLADARAQLDAAAKKEAELLRTARRADERARQLEADAERRLADETANLRAEAEAAAKQRIARATADVARQKDAELDDVRGRLEAASKREAELERRAREVEARAQQLDADVERRVVEQAQKMRSELECASAERVARAAAAARQAKDAELADLRTRLDAAALREAAMVKTQHDAEERARNAALDAQRKSYEELARARADLERAFREREESAAAQRSLEHQEHRAETEALERKIRELQEQVTRRSQQAHGEAQEVVLRDVLAAAFPADLVEDVAKGERGADLLHTVRSEAGHGAGAILWESKRTRCFSEAWLAKLRDDQREAGAVCAVLVSQALPAGLEQFELRDGVWICAWRYAPALAAVLRQWLCDVAEARRAGEGRDVKMQMLYAYLTGPEFRNRVSGLCEAFVEMQEDLERERRAVLGQLRKRGRQLERALTNITAFYGDLRGFAGRTLAELPAMALSSDAAVPHEDLEQPAPDSRGWSAQLAQLLTTLLPPDGSPVGNTTLRASLGDQALAQLGHDMTDAEYESAKSLLVAQGLARRGKGRGGSLARAVPCAQVAE